MKVSAVIKNEFNKNEIVVSTNNTPKLITIPSKPGGYGSSINGGELLLLSLATCYCNDIYREAAKRNIEISAVNIEFTGEFGGAGDPGHNFSYTPHITSNATEKEIEDLINYTDHIAEIHQTLRQGTTITLLK